MNYFKTRLNFFLSTLIIIFLIVVPLINSEHVRRSSGREEHGSMTHNDHMNSGTITIPQYNEQDELLMGVGKNPFWLKEQNFMLWFHIISMTVSFGTLIPIGIVLGFANSKSIWFINLQIIGMLIAIMGFVFATMLKSLDVYPSNFHSKFSWMILSLFFTQMLIGFIKFSIFLISDKNDKNDKVKYMNISLSNNESNESLVTSVDSSSASSHDIESPVNDSLFDSSTIKENFPSNNNNFYTKLRSKILSILPSSLLSLSKKFFIISYIFSSWILIFSIYTQFLLGFITLSDTCHDESLGNCLAHYIKGSIFIWFGLVAFIRYLGFFEKFGWEWNLLPISTLDNFNDEKNQKGKISFSLLESIIIFSYGIINTFLEHTGKDQSWNHRDVQHATLAFMWWWAGLLGIILENKKLRKILFSKSKVPLVNPIPSIIFIVTAISISSHHQKTEFSLSIHRQFGGFLLLAGIFRLFTIIILYFTNIMNDNNNYNNNYNNNNNNNLNSKSSTTKSSSKSLTIHPPTELISSFCFVSSGITLMLSNKSLAFLFDDIYNFDVNFVLNLVISLSFITLSFVTILLFIYKYSLKK